jgi:hypothetical protein
MVSEAETVGKSDKEQTGSRLPGLTCCLLLTLGRFPSHEKIENQDYEESIEAIHLGDDGLRPESL